MPGDGSVRRERYLEFETQGNGKFGWISQGVDIKTGNLVAIKELRISSHQSHLEAIAEVNMGYRFLVSTEFLENFSSFFKPECGDSTDILLLTNVQKL